MPNTPVYVNLLLFVAGLLVIIKGSDLFLDNAVWIARVSGVPQIVIGATLVSLCTTLPELVSSSTAAVKGAMDMALGNAVGSVICNTGLIMGVMLLFIVARAGREVFLVKGVFMLGALGAALLLILPDPNAGGVSRIERPEGGVLLAMLLIYLVVNYYESLHGLAPQPSEEDLAEEKPVGTPREWRRRLSFFCGGGALVAGGAYLLIEFGQRLARDMGVSEAVISLIFVAFGTSLPELFTAISAVRKKATQISVGNIFGANVMNITLVTGTSALIRPLQITDLWLMRFDIPVAIGLGAIAFGSGLCTGRMGRRTGVCLLTLYIAYMVTRLAMGRMGGV